MAKGCVLLAKEALELWKTGNYKTKTEAVKKVCSENGYVEVETVRKQLSALTRKEQALSEGSGALIEECESVGLPVENVKQYWYKSERFSINLTGGSVVTYDHVRDEIIEDMKNHAPKYPTIKRSQIKEGHLLVVDPADVHIGKLCSSSDGGTYNVDIAVQRVREGVQGIINKSKGFEIDKILFITGNDILHTDTTKRTTTSGTPQDTDGMWHENFITARKLYVEIIEMLLPIADIHVVFNPSNHDYMAGYYLLDSISSWFSKSKNITFDCSITHRKYFKYGKNLIGCTHGDGAKLINLGPLMATEKPEMWGETRHRYFYTHHVHHKQSKDQIGITIESLRSPSGSDAWHNKEGYTGVPKAVEGFIHHKEDGQVARISHIFK